jgi:hypothetical protein
MAPNPLPPSHYVTLHDVTLSVALTQSPLCSDVERSSLVDLVTGVASDFATQ